MTTKGKDLEISVLDGNCKLQWKVDWAMRWYALDVDFEMYGKDLIESAILSTKIIKLIGKKILRDLLMNYFWMKRVKKFLNLKVMELQ